MKNKFISLLLIALFFSCKENHNYWFISDVAKEWTSIEENEPIIMEDDNGIGISFAYADEEFDVSLSEKPLDDEDKKMFSIKEDNSFETASRELVSTFFNTYSTFIQTYADGKGNTIQYYLNGTSFIVDIENYPVTGNDVTVSYLRNDNDVNIEILDSYLVNNTVYEDVLFYELTDKQALVYSSEDTVVKIYIAKGKGLIRYEYLSGLAVNRK